MPAAIEGAVDLVAVACVLLLIGMLMAVRYTLTPLVAVLDVSILGVRPFGHLANAVRNTVLAWCQSGIGSLVRILSDLFHGMAWAVRWQLHAITDFAHAVEHSFDLLWRHAIVGLAASITKGLAKAVAKAEADVAALGHTVTAEVKAAEALAVKEVAAALAKAERFATSEAERAASAALQTALADIHTLSTAVGDLAASLDARLTGLAGEIGSELSAAEQYANARAAAAERAAAGEVSDAVAQLDQLIAGTAAGLEAEIGAITLPNVADLAAAVAAVTATVALVLTETGLDSPAWRAKVKGICGTNPLEWAGLLAGLAAFGGLPTLRQLVDVGVQAVDQVSGAVEGWALGQ